MNDVKDIKYDPKGFTVVDTFEVEESRGRSLPNSNPGRDEDQRSYQDHPWDKQPTPKTTI